MIIRVLESGRALEDLRGSWRVLNSPKGLKGVQNRTIGIADHGGMEGLLGSGRAHEGV